MGPRPFIFDLSRDLPVNRLVTRLGVLVKIEQDIALWKTLLRWEVWLQGRTQQVSDRNRKGNRRDYQCSDQNRVAIDLIGHFLLI